MIPWIAYRNLNETCCMCCIEMCELYMRSDLSLRILCVQNRIHVIPYRGVIIMESRAARLNIRTTEAARSAIEHAAHFLGITTSAFVLECAVIRASQILEQANTIFLNAKESKRFLDALDHPPKPNANLKCLFVKYKKKK